VRRTGHSSLGGVGAHDIGDDLVGHANAIQQAALAQRAAHAILGDASPIKPGVERRLDPSAAWAPSA
jgi:hypothetical protein